MIRDLRLLIVLGCFLLSGFAGLIYQTAWTQQFAFVFGTSELAVATVLAAYMGGLMVGAQVAGRWIHRLERPLWVYGLLELGIAASALMVPHGLKAARWLQRQWFQIPSLADDSLGGNLQGIEPALSGLSAAPVAFYVISAFAILLIPTALMGATLPILARHVIQTDQQVGARISWLYGVNTTGAAAGTLVAAFLLLPRLGLGLTVWVAIALNATIFLLALLLERKPELEIQAPSSRSPDSDSGLDTSPSSLRVRRNWILPVMLVSGTVSFCWEVLWTRLLSHLLGGSIYAFGTMLATFLLGIALGSLIASRWADTHERARRAFSLSQLGIASTSLGAYLLVDALPIWLGSFPGHLLHAAAAVLTLLPGALFIGSTYPFAVRILAGNASQAGRSSARVYAWNTFGAIIGATATGFFILPTLQLSGTVRLATGLSCSLAAISAVQCRSRRLNTFATAILLLLGICVFSPPTPWTVLRTSPLSRQTIPGEVSFFSVGRSSTVLVSEQQGLWRLSSNGLPESAILPQGARRGAFSIARWLSLLPTLARPELESMLIIGLGAGITLDAVPESIDEVHVVELEPEVVRAHRALAHIRERDPLHSPRARLHIHDARSLLHLSPRSFSAIVSQPSHPWTAGASHLFTREFFQLVHERLEPSGVFVQWIGLRFLSPDLLRSLVATLNHVFPYVEVYQPPPGGALLFLASKEALLVDETVELSFAKFREDWQTVGHHSPQSVFATRRLDAEGSRRLSHDAEISTDALNLLQAYSPKAMKNPLSPEQTAQLFNDFDPLLQRYRAGSLEDPVAYVHTLVQQGDSSRAASLAEILTNEADRQTALAILDVQHRRLKSARQRLIYVLEELPEQSEQALNILTLLDRKALLQGRRPALKTWIDDRNGDAAVVLEAWRRKALGNRAGLATLEARLSTVPPQSALYVAATRLRIHWREVSEDSDRIEDALSLLDGLLAMQNQSIRGLIQRAELAGLAADAPRLRASFDEILRRLQSTSNAAAASDALLALDATPASLREAISYSSLRVALQLAAQQSGPVYESS